MRRLGLSLFTTLVGLALLAKTTNTPAIIEFWSTNDGFGVFNDGSTTYEDGANNVKAYFFPSGNAGLETGVPRRLCIDFRGVVQGGQTPFTADCVQAVISHQLLKTDANNAPLCCAVPGGLLGMSAGTQWYSRMTLTFPDPNNARDSWQLFWGPTDNTVNSNGLATTSYLNTVAFGTSWQVSTGANPICGTSNPNCDIAALSLISRNKTTLQGYYHLPFNFTIRTK